MRTLVQGQAKKFNRHLFIGWDKLSISNVRKREAAFRKFCPDGEIVRVPWRRDRSVGETDMQKIEKTIRNMGEVLIVCNNGELGQRTAELLREMSMSKKAALAVVDDFEGSVNYTVSVYRQDLAGDAERIYRQLEEQAKAGRGWKARNWEVKGIYAVYEEGEE